MRHEWRKDGEGTPSPLTSPPGRLLTALPLRVIDAVPHSLTDSLTPLVLALSSRGGPNLTGKPGSSRNIVQYAVLNLASLHFRFGHLDMAMAAINETVRIAQQNGDRVCVAYALAWLHQLLMKSGVRGSGRLC